MICGGPDLFYFFFVGFPVKVLARRYDGAAHGEIHNIINDRG